MTGAGTLYQCGTGYKEQGFRMVWRANARLRVPAEVVGNMPRVTLLRVFLLIE
jgi:hypothetical protein